MVDRLLSSRGVFYLVTVQENRPWEIIELMKDRCVLGWRGSGPGFPKFPAPCRYGMEGCEVLRRVADEELLIILRFHRKHQDTSG